MLSYVILDALKNGLSQQVLVRDELYQECIDEGGGPDQFFQGEVTDAQKSGTIEMEGTDEYLLEECYVSQG